MQKINVQPEIAKLKVADIKTDLDNPRSISDEALQGLRSSLQRFGYVDFLIVNKRDMVLVSGHQRLSILKQDGVEEVTCILVDLDESQRRAMAVTMNSKQITGEWTAGIHEYMKKLKGDLPEKDYLSLRLDALKKEVARIKPEKPEINEAPAPEVAKEAKTKRGQVYQLGAHRIMCGDCTNEDEVRKLMDGKTPDLLLTDPPYCSGGFQEGGKTQGSVGTDAPHKQIANDRLSTRGVTLLLKNCLTLVPTKYLYAFTDWRMWVNLFDIVESCAYSVRSMIVWNKKTAGMGYGWRTQHELIMWATKETPPYDKQNSGAGNVITEDRSGNVHHTTEKPLAVIAGLIQNTEFAKTVYDPFCGSGTTILAAEQLGVAGFGMELDPLYCDVIVKRWEDFTGQKAQLIA